VSSAAINEFLKSLNDFFRKPFSKLRTSFPIPVVLLVSLWLADMAVKFLVAEDQHAVLQVTMGDQ
jgi:hypothetical protein